MYGPLGVCFSYVRLDHYIVLLKIFIEWSSLNLNSMHFSLLSDAIWLTDTPYSIYPTCLLFGSRL